MTASEQLTAMLATAARSRASEVHQTARRPPRMRVGRDRDQIEEKKKA